MKKFYSILPLPYFIFALLLSCILASGQTTVGSGSYTTVFPGADVAGRNGFPSGTPQLSKTAAGKPVPTNDWWSALIKENHADNLFNYPMTMKTTNTGLIVTYIPRGVIGDNSAIEVGLTDLNTAKATVSDYSDWTVTMNWNDGVRDLQATSGIGMPFVYFEKNSGTTANVTVNSGTVTVSSELLIVENASNGVDFVVYAPAGSTWSASGNTYTSSLNGKNYWSMAMLPQSTTNVSATAQAYKKYAYVFPTNTTTSWVYDATTAKVTTDFLVSTEVKEGTHTNVLMGLLPHQWANLDSSSPTPGGQSYNSIRGELKMLDGNNFKVENTFKGVLPTLPYLANYSNGFDPNKLDEKIGVIENDALNPWTDSYNEGQMMNRMIQTARIADQMGDTEALNKMIATIKERLEDWLSFQAGEVAFLFYYNNDWSALLGYPAGHGQDGNLNDHHFHWGYFIHAAAFMEQFEPGWADDWGDMVNLLVRDAASSDRNDTLFPFLRNFSPYAGHSWANGFATFPQGNDQESSSESMQFATSLIHWGSITANDAIRDLGIYIYTTEQSATEEYFFDMYNRVFGAGQPYKLVSRVWGNSYDNGTFFTSDIAASYGIELYPIHGGSLYLGHNKTYAAELWDEMASRTGILSNEANDDLWHDTYWKFLSLTDAQAAIDLYDSYPNRGLKFGISDAQTYHWLHAMNALGPVDASITSNHPLAVAFTNDSGTTTYVAQNYSNSQISVSFSDGYVLDVAANTLATSRDVQVSGTLISDFSQAFVGGSINLTYSTSNTNITKVEFYDGTSLISTDTTAPYQAQPNSLALGIHGMYAKVFLGTEFAVSNSVSVQVGEQVPYDAVHAIPGTIEAGHFDTYEAGVGQNISYFDSSIINEGGARTDEYVDTATDTNEGMTVGWIAAGEWLEYSIDVQNAGTYSVDIRYASGNPNGGGPMHFELDGETISGSISFSTTSNWGTWTTKTVTGIPLTGGEHILRVAVDGGEFNLGRMTFLRTGDLGYDPPIADAGTNVSATLSSSSVTLDGSGTYEPSGKTVTYTWSQIYGPTQLNFVTSSSISPQISNLAIGVYKCLLTVSDGTYTSSDEVQIIVSESGNSNPSVSISSPADGTSFAEGSAIDITAVASDLDGTVDKVEFFTGSTKIGEDTSDPFTFTWNGAAVGTHQLTAKATDNGGGVATSQAVAVTVNEVASCVITDDTASQGSFSVGYETTFETVGTNVTITIKLLDTDKIGVTSYLWRENPFQESEMNHVEGKTFSKTVGGLSAGQTISYAVKFAFEGGMAVTKYMSYIVGNDCSGSVSDTEGPTNFTATVGTVGAQTVELLLQANDNSGSVIYDVTYGQEQKSVTGNSGAQTSLVVNGLSPETTYNFSVTAKDISQNAASNNPISLQATTTANTNTACSGTDDEASQGSFSTGYAYSFTTSGTSVTFTFELLDTDKSGVVAHLWRQAPNFTETAMSGSGNTFSATVSGFTVGETISYACKFAYAGGGQAVTKYFSYEVGDVCTFSIDDVNLFTEVTVYPNPVKDVIYVSEADSKPVKLELFSVNGKKIKEQTQDVKSMYVDDLSSGLYLLKVYHDKKHSFHRIVKE
ncbi:MAG: glycosyl hydrolase [Flavobacteriaceae bacterium]